MENTALFFLLAVVVPIVASTRPCERRYFYGDNDPNFAVCMCNATYCDDFPPLGRMTADSTAVYETSMAGKRFERTTVKWTEIRTIQLGQEGAPQTNLVRLSLSGKETMQSIIGFGGAFTDSAGLNIASLDGDAQEQLLQAYFGRKGIEYTIGRVPMASTDFSASAYSYDDVDGDFELKKFALASEDVKLKIPYIKRAIDLTSGNIKLFATPWSPPGWMKDTGKMIGGGQLKGKPGDRYERAWTQYFIRFLEEYAKKGITFWGLTPINQPTSGHLPPIKWQAMTISPDEEKNFIKNALGPALRNSSLGKDIAIMICDDQRPMAKLWADAVFKDPQASKYANGLAIHWYMDDVAPVELYTKIHNDWPDKFILSTEACVSFSAPVLGNWTNGDRYAHSIISNLNNWVAGWTDWNLALDVDGGPNLVGNLADSPILIDADKGEFYKQPMYYIMGHFSKFVRPRSKRVALKWDSVDEQFEAVAFSTPTDQHVLVVRNNGSVARDLEIDDDEGRPGQLMRLSIQPHSVMTLVWDKLEKYLKFSPYNAYSFYKS